MRAAAKPFDATIRRHGVLAADRNPFAGIKGAESLTLTDFQADLLEHKTPIRIGSAPTGAGKTFAFEWAPALGLNILFVVPTKRLAQNLERNVRATMTGPIGWGEEEVSRRLAVWSSDEVARKEIAGMTRREIRQERVAQLRGRGFAEKGSFIIATPESIAWLLLSPPPPTHGQSGMGIADLLGRHHIVFDEFHTIEEQGVGIAAALCKVTSGLADAGAFGVRPRVTFLSATPVEIAPLLEAFNVPRSEIVHLEEKVHDWDAGEEPTGARVIHGDVSVSMNYHNDIAQACRTESHSIAKTLASGSSVICVFDSLARIQAMGAEVSKVFQGYGVTKDRIVTINSIDDAHDLRVDGCGRSGRNADPARARVILATSSIEIGVTFDASLMIMEPGFSEASFIQRLGRVARRDVPGRVIVVKGGNAQVGADLLRGQKKQMEAGGDTRRVSIDTFTSWVLRRRIAAFHDTDLLSDRITYKTMSSRAVWCAGLFWVAMERSWTNHKGERDTLRAYAPSKAKAIGMWIKAIEGSDSREARDWVRQFVLQARALRSIEPRLRVKFRDKEDHVPLSMAGRYSVISNATVAEDSDGSFLALPRSLKSILRDGDTRRYQARHTPYPFCVAAQVGSVKASEAVGEWVRKTKYLLAAEGYPTGEGSLFEIAERLVRTTALVPSMDAVDADAAGDGTGVV